MNSLERGGKTARLAAWILLAAALSSCGCEDSEDAEDDDGSATYAWMAENWGALKGKTLMAVSFPGSHNSGSTPELSAAKPHLASSTERSCGGARQRIRPE